MSSIGGKNASVGQIRLTLDGRIAVTAARLNRSGICEGHKQSLEILIRQTNGYDADGHLVAHWTPAKGLTQYSFDDNGNLTSVAYSSGPSIRAGYDSLNRITSMSDAVGASSFSYTNFGAFMGALSTETSPWASGTVTHNYANRLPVSLTLADPSASDADIKVTRDLILAGQLLKIEILDHVIIGAGDSYQSLKSLGCFY